MVSGKSKIQQKKIRQIVDKNTKICEKKMFSPQSYLSIITKMNYYISHKIWTTNIWAKAKIRGKIAKPTYLPSLATRFIKILRHFSYSTYTTRLILGNAILFCNCIIHTGTKCKRPQPYKCQIFNL